MNAPLESEMRLPRTVRVRLALLLVCHGVASALFIAGERFEWFGKELLAVYFAQPGLLALGIVLTYRQRAFRVGLAAVGLPVLLLFAQLALENDVDSMSIAVMTLVVFAATLWGAAMVRTLGYSVRRIRSDALAETRPLRFSIRQLLLATALIAAMIALPRWVQSLEEYWQFIIPLHSGMLILIVISYGVQLAGLTAVQLLALWAALGVGSLPARIVVALAGMSCVGWVPGWYIEESLDWDRAAVYVLVGIISLLTFFVVRSCGFRLVHCRSRHQAAPTELFAPTVNV